MSDYCHYCNYFDDEEEYICDRTNPNVCKPCQKLRELETKIRETRKMLVGLANERQKLKEEANRIHDRIVHRLPFEVVADIFEMCLPQDVMNIDLHRANRYTISAPFILSAVCKLWRTITHSTPQLWKNLLLCGGEGTEEKSYFPLPDTNIVEEWIQRAGAYPLSISLCMRREERSIIRADEPSLTMNIIGILNRHSDRWSQLKYEGPSYLLSYFRNDEDLPQLRQLRIDAFHIYGSLDGDQRTLKLRPSQLNALTLRSLVLDVGAFNWQELEKLDIGPTLLSHCFAILQKGSQLIRCIFRYLSKGEFCFPPPQIIFHQKIQHLEITESPWYKDIIENLACPSLKKLVLSSNRPDTMQVIADFLMRSDCALESFSLETEHMSESDIFLLYQAMPTLQHLCIYASRASSPPIGRILFSSLAEFSITNGKREPLYLPFLNSLKLDEDIQFDLSH
ncbi:hypothetical protein BDN70DRAFT_880120 [Pholiota conissans]|uniref:F-box domain-containing protein n=1 Tax=Pholiota conissans TaxID=109636 RepID=A0A9P5YZG9_9AGAR|nr:hypothetical protein BDN70DRAFT_880120 [Pholiota conissans]